MKLQLFTLAAALLVATAASAQTAPPTTASSGPPPVAKLVGPEACLKDLEAESKNYETKMNAGLANGSIDPSEKKVVEGKHQRLLNAEKYARKDGKLTDKECVKLVQLAKDETGLLDAYITGEVTAKGACAKEVSDANKSFAADIKAGIASKKIDAKEQARLEKYNATLLAKEATLKDGTFTAKDCKSFLNVIKSERKVLEKALKS
jgi:hypothetical protein